MGLVSLERDHQRAESLELLARSCFTLERVAVACWLVCSRRCVCLRVSSAATIASSENRGPLPFARVSGRNRIQLRGFGRLGARLILQQTLEDEVSEFLGRGR